MPRTSLAILALASLLVAACAGASSPSGDPSPVATATTSAIPSATPAQPTGTPARPSETPGAATDGPEYPTPAGTPAASPTRTPSPTATPRATRTPAPTVRVTPSPTPAATPAPTLSPTPTPQPTPASACVPATGTGTPVAMTGFAFAPASVSIPVGGSVTWTNADDAVHNATFAAGACASSDVTLGESTTVRFVKAGTWSYLCTVHPSMQGTVTVSG